MTDRAIAEEFVAELKRHIETGTYKDPAAFDHRVAEEVVLHTPRFWRPITDRNWMLGILSMVPQAIEGFTYHRHWIDGHDVIMEFAGDVGGLRLQGIDIFTLDPNGKITELTVLVRPPNALAGLGEREDAMLKKLFGVATQAEFTSRKG
jgi:hypothetical protein